MSLRRRPGSIVPQARGRAYDVRFWLEGKEIVRAGGSTQDVARRKLARIEAMAADGVPAERILHEVFGDPLADERTISFRDAAELFLKQSIGRRKPSTIDSYRQIFGLLERQPWIGEEARSITHRSIASWVAEQQESGVSGATINRRISALSAVFRWAVREGHADANPMARIQKFSERGRARETYLVETEARALVDAATPDLAPVIICALSTGLRKGELLALTWSSIDFERRFLTVESENAKSGRSRTIPLSRWLEEALLPLAPAPGAPRVGRSVFVTSDGRPFNSWQLRKRFDAAVASCAAIPEEKKPKVTMHTLRHTAASLMVAAGVPIFDVSKVLGHSTIGVTMRYAHFAPQAGRQAIDALDRMLRPEAYPPELSEGPVGYRAMRSRDAPKSRSSRRPASSPTWPPPMVPAGRTIRRD